MFRWARSCSLRRNRRTRRELRSRDNDPMGHAEIVAMRDAAQTIGDWRLTDVRST